MWNESLLRNACITGLPMWYHAVVATNSIQYDKRMVAFLDILGFERIVNKSRDDTEIIRKLASMLKTSKHTALGLLQSKPTVLKADPTQYEYRAFSDTSVIAGPYTSHDDLVFLSAWIMYYQYILWKEEQNFLRGAIVYGDIYLDEDIMFGPAIVDAYHLEKDTGKAVWPRVLIDEGLLHKVKEGELKRDFFEIFKRDDNHLVYCDYLREFFHLRMYASLEKTTGKIEQDFGDPAELFADHQAAILTQVRNTLKGERDDRRKREIIGKYVELSKYHNDTIDTLCHATDELLANPDTMREVFDDTLESGLRKRTGEEYKPRFSVEDHPEQADTLNILGTISGRILHKYIGDSSEWEEALQNLVKQVPEELDELRQSLVKSRIDLDSIKAHL